MDIETYVITIKPESPFGTPLKGDTIFGQFCWQVAEHPNLLNGGLDKWIEIYDERPFAVFSSAYPVLVEDNRVSYAFKRPEFPMYLLVKLLGDVPGAETCEKRLLTRKKNKKKRWFLVEEDLEPLLSWDKFIDDKELYRKIFNILSDNEKAILEESYNISSWSYSLGQQHNSINRLTMTTGEGDFAPYITKNIWYLPGVELAIFVAFDREACSIEQIQDGLTRIGEWGFGRDASIGLGRFSLGEYDQIDWPHIAKGEDIITLSPCVPEQNTYEDCFFSPFIRFGRHGGVLASSGCPFKKPIVMADEGAVFRLKQNLEIDTPYIGRAVKNASIVQKSAVVQGYSLVLPLKI